MEYWESESRIIYLFYNFTFPYFMKVSFWFHIELYCYKALRKFIYECGMPYILVESGFLESGSLSGFLEGKNYNRCKRIHELTAIAFA
jgi:hypothetical protein